ncbi:MAG: hypothetical protein NTZ53_02710 [Cyanobacteria bacterium]|nr:hypothetical protein [Cyanobacteriota bacterium]
MTTPLPVLIAATRRWQFALGKPDQGPWFETPGLLLNIIPALGVSQANCRLDVLRC